MIKQRSLLTYILLSIVTCGIYSIYFWYKFAEDTNITCQGDGEETTNYIVCWLLGMVTCGIYPLYWYYKLGNRLQRNAPRYGLAFQESGTTILLWYILGSFIIVGPFIAFYFLMKNLNAIGERYNSLSMQYQQPQVNVNVYTDGQAQQQYPPQGQPPYPPQGQPYTPPQNQPTYPPQGTYPAPPQQEAPPAPPPQNPQDPPAQT